MLLEMAQILYAFAPAYAADVTPVLVRRQAEKVSEGRHRSGFALWKQGAEFFFRGEPRLLPPKNGGELSEVDLFRRRQHGQNEVLTRLDDRHLGVLAPRHVLGGGDLLSRVGARVHDRAERTRFSSRNCFSLVSMLGTS